jgi:hypothetical protein
MPHHTKEKSGGDSGAGGAGPRHSAATAAPEGGESKRGVGGRAMGKAALKARQKNAKAVNDFLTLVEGVRDYKEMDAAVEREGLRLARVTKMTGCSHLDVQLHDGRTVNLGIAASIKGKGRAANKGDRENYMLAGDLIVVRDAHAAGKIPIALVKELEAEFVRVGAMYPAGFFTQGMEEAVGAIGWEFDRSGAADRHRSCIRGDAAAVAEKDSDDEDEGDLDVDAI